MKSALLPGLGEYSLGNNARGNTFLFTEISLISAAVVSSVWADHETSAMISYAADHAGVQTAGKSDQYWVDIGNYDSLDDYNAEHLRWRDFEGIYTGSQENNWSWESDSQRKKFRDLRVHRDQLQQTAKFIIGAVVVNHIVSAVDALYLSRIAQQNFSYSPVFDSRSGRVIHSISVNF